MIERVAVVPHPPLLVPELASGAAAETAALREACLAAARALAEVSSRWVAVAAADPVPSPGTGTFGGFGVDVPVTLTPQSDGALGSSASAGLPLALLVAGWLRGQVGPGSVTVHPECVPQGSPPTACGQQGRELARQLAAGAEPVGLLVLGDGAATHTLRAPGFYDARAEGYDAAVAAALGDPDLPALQGLDASLADELMVAGREAWQTGAAAAQACTETWHGELLHSSAPYGVGYHVAVWEPAR